MAREAKIQIFQGTTPKPTRVYLQALLAKLRGNYDRLVVPCAGRFTVPQVARAAGWAPERIIASEISLFSTVVGYVAAGRDLAELQISFGAELAWRLDQYKGGDRFAAAVLYAMKWAQLAAGKNSYLKAQREELDFQTDFYVEEFHQQLLAFKATLGPIEFRVADVFAEMAACQDDDKAICYVNPPAYSNGYLKMFAPIAEHVAWADPAIPEFEPKTGLQQIFDYARSAKALTIWYRYQSVSAAEEPFVVFGHEYRADRIDFTLVSRPEEAALASSPRPVTKIATGGWSILPPKYQITEKSVIQCHAVSKEVPADPVQRLGKRLRHLVVDQPDLIGILWDLQLAHNSIAGADNETTLRQIFSEITSVEARLESFVYVDDSFLKGIDASVKMVNEEISIKWPVLAVTFLPSQLARYEHVAERLAKQIPKDTDQVWLINDEMAKAFSETLNRIGRHFDIRTNGNIIARMVEIVNAELDREAAAASPPAVEQEPEQPEQPEQLGSENPEGRLAGRTRRRSSTNAGSKPAPRSNSGEPAEGSTAA